MIGPLSSIKVFSQRLVVLLVTVHLVCYFQCRFSIDPIGLSQYQMVIVLDRFDKKFNDLHCTHRAVQGREDH